MCYIFLFLCSYFFQVLQIRPILTEIVICQQQNSEKFAIGINEHYAKIKSR